MPKELLDNIKKVFSILIKQRFIISLFGSFLLMFSTLAFIAGNKGWSVNEKNQENRNDSQTSTTLTTSSSILDNGSTSSTTIPSTVTTTTDSTVLSDNSTSTVTIWNNSSTTTSSSSTSTTTTSTSSSSTSTSTTQTTIEYPSAVVAFYSDNQSDSDSEDLIHQNTVNNVLNSGANPVFHAGDLMEDGAEASWNRFWSVTSTLRASRAFYAALGNNDREYGDPSTPSHFFLDNFYFPNNEQWYSINYGNLHMIILDSAFSSGSGAQLSWLASDLQSEASQSRITGVMFHHPSFASSISSYLVNYGADFVVQGHNHAYSHYVSNGINYFVMSGQTSLGYMVVRVYSDKVTFTDYNNWNGVVESGEFSER